MEPWLARAQSTDVDDVLAIERAVFERPWTRQSVAHELERADGLNVLAREHEGGRLLGYCIGWTVAGEAELLRIAVLPEFRRQSLAKRLMQHFVAGAQQSASAAIFLEVSQANLPAWQLYRSFAFEEVGRRKGYYQESSGPQDAIVMRRLI